MNQNIAICGRMGAGKTTLAKALEPLGYTRTALADPLKQMAEAVRGRPLRKDEDRTLLQALGQMGRDPKWAKVHKALSSDPAPHIASPHGHQIEAACSIIRELLGPCPWDWAEGADWASSVVRLKALLYEGEHPMAHNFGSVSFWVDKLVEKVTTTPGPWVVDDVRFPNEAAALSFFGFKVILIDTPLAVCKERILHRDGKWDDKWLEDVSEKQLEFLTPDLALDGRETPETLVTQLIHSFGNQRAA